MKSIKFTAFLFLTVLTASCASEAGNNSNSTQASSGESYKTAIVASNTTARSNSTGNGSGGGGGGDLTERAPNIPATAQVSAQSINIQQSAVTERKIVRNADLSLETDLPEEAQQKIASIADGKGGFVVESTQSSSNIKATTRDTVTMTVRVPAEKFNETLDEIRKTASRVIVETVKGEDVTEEFIDIEARLKAQKSLEAQFIEIMKRANSVEDALNVQRQLAQVRGDIEKIEGRKRFLENAASLSTVKVRLQTPAAFSTNSSGFFYRLSQSAGSGFDAALTFILGFVSVLIALLPFLILVVLPSFLIIRYFWNRRSKQKSASEIAKEEIKDK